MTADRDSRSAVEKALTLLGAFGVDAGFGLGVSELARRADLSKSTTFRLLATMENIGAVERAGTAYRIGPLIHKLADPGAEPATEFAREALTPWLVKLFTATRQTVHMAMLDGNRVVYLNKLHGLHPVPSPSRIGGRAPAFCTGVGKALLAHESELAARVLDEPMPRWTPYTITDPVALAREFESVRRRGVAYDRQEIQLGLSCIAAPVMGLRGPVAAFSVSGPAGSFDPAQFERELREICFEASRAIRGRQARMAGSR